VGNVRWTLFILLGAVDACLVIAAQMWPIFLCRVRLPAKRNRGADAWGQHGRIVRQLLTESVLLAVCGGLLGILFAVFSVHWIHILGPKRCPG